MNQWGKDMDRDMNKRADLFKTITVNNRLNMEFEIDVNVALIENELIVIVKANEHYHRSTVSKNIEQIAFQLKKRFATKNNQLSIIEYIDRHQNQEEWWQWRFHWVGGTPLNGQRYLLSASKVEWVQCALLNDSWRWMNAS